MNRSETSKNIFSSYPVKVAGVVGALAISIGIVEGVADNKAERVTYGSLTCEGSQPLPAEADQTLDDFINTNRAKILGLSVGSETDMRGVTLLKLGEEPFYQNPNETNLRFKAAGYYNLPLACN